MGSASASAMCSLTDDGLTCPGETRIEVMEALASDATADLFTEPQNFSQSLGASPQTREAFRLELESIRRVIERQQRADRRAERRGHISAEDFAEREALYLKAIENYREAYWFYQNLAWRSDD
ncbi:MAG: hypothetical protein AAFY73_06340 [Pseudomonadota bacterium]